MTEQSELIFRTPDHINRHEYGPTSVVGSPASKEPSATHDMMEDVVTECGGVYILTSVSGRCWTLVDSDRRGVTLQTVSRQCYLRVVGGPVRHQ